MSEQDKEAVKDTTLSALHDKRDCLAENAAKILADCFDASSRREWIPDVRPFG